MCIPEWFTGWPLWCPHPILDYRKWISITFLAISYQYAILYFFFTKWLPAAILDDWKYLLIAFLAISDQYSNFIYCLFCSQNGCHFGSPICAKNNRVLPLSVINGFAKYEVDRWIYDTVRDATSFLKILYKMATRGHFVFPIDAKNHRVLVIWDLNGDGEYEFDRCICDEVMACTSVDSHSIDIYMYYKHIRSYQTKTSKQRFLFDLQLICWLFKTIGICHIWMYHFA